MNIDSKIEHLRKENKEKHQYTESILLPEGFRVERSLIQEMFIQRLPQIIDRIRNENITNVILCETGAVVFKLGLERVLQHSNLQNVKVASFHPRYFSVEYNPDNHKINQEHKEQQIKQKLPFLADDCAKDQCRIMIIDEVKVSGNILNRMREGLINEFGLEPDKIISEHFPGNNSSHNKFSNAVISVISHRLRHELFQPADFQKEGTYHPILLEPLHKYKQKYKSTINDISEMMLKGVEINIEYKRIKKHILRLLSRVTVTRISSELINFKDKQTEEYLWDDDLIQVLHKILTENDFCVKISIPKSEFDEVANKLFEQFEFVNKIGKSWYDNQLSFEKAGGFKPKRKIKVFKKRVMGNGQLKLVYIILIDND